MSAKDPAPATSNFIREQVLADGASQKFGGRVRTRFPPEPNGYLHVGHAKAMCIDFGLAREFGGRCNLRFDDTNPTTEDVEYVESIQADIRWLGFQWDSLHYASDYFEQLYQYAETLIQKGVAYVDSLNEEEIREYRGNYYKKGKESPYRNRTVEENLDLFRRMRAGEFKEGEHVLRAKIDLNSQNMNLRDPLLYRIRYASHHRTGNKWCIYPLYDYAHPLSDAIEEITHSICTLEFEAHRPLYDWCIHEAGAFPSQQIEFARGNLTYTVMSKRKLLELVKGKHVSGWDDPRMPTLAGMRRRGFTPEAIRAFWERVGVAKADSTVDVGLLEHTLREDLNARCKRTMAVLRPLKLTITNVAEGEVRWIDAPFLPDEPEKGTRKIPFTRTLYVEHDDVRAEDPTPGAPRSLAFNRLAPGKKVRLRYVGIVECTRVDLAAGEVQATLTEDKKADGTIHWVSAAHAVDAEVRLYDRLFSVENPGTTEGKSFLEELNPDSLVRLPAKLEPWLATASAGETVQFERLGYFRRDEAGGWNRAVTLKDTWAKIEKKAAKVETPETKTNEIGIEEFGKVDLRVAVVKEAALVEGADKLIRVMVDLGEGRDRQVFAGLRASYPDPSVLVGKRVVVVANLKPRQMKFGLSEGMILAAGKMVLSADESAKPGDKVS
ncbi:MAG TPA: glutamine--tRNA ligase/YqeY domain fusion protein [Polyangia bacterium]|jgi:glutaminyl-tRNA synthetase